MPTTRSKRAVSETAEDYVKAIYALEHASSQTAPVGTNDLARRLNVSAASASAMVKKLAGHGLVSHKPYHGAHLTEAGTQVALAVMRRHRLLELYLTEKLGLSWDRARNEADVLEHVVSSELEECIATRLGNPRLDHPGAIPLPPLS